MLGRRHAWRLPLAIRIALAPAPVAAIATAIDAVPHVPKIAARIAIPRLPPRPIARHAHQTRRRTTPRQPRIQHPQPAPHPEPPHRAIPQRRTTRATGADAVGAMKTFPRGDDALVELNEIEEQSGQL